jgi:hypothetical protein
MPDAENAEQHGVAVKTIRRWRREYQRRGKPRGQEHLSALCPRCGEGALDEPAYAELLGWYLGDGHLSRGRREVWNLHIFNDVRYLELNAHVQDLMRRVKPNCRPHTRLVPGCLITTVGWKHWPCLFPQHGPGRKHERHLGMEQWQWDVVTTHPGDFLRGLFHSDGCRMNNYSTRVVEGRPIRCYYPRWQFTNNSQEIRDWCCEALDMVGIAWRQSNWKTISVARRNDVQRLDDLLGLKA